VTVTTIKVDSAVRDRLARLAAEQGRSIGAVVADLAARTPTKEEVAADVEAARQYFRDNFGMDLTDDDLAEGERFWQRVEARQAAKRSS
jgi:hypothetical protein